MFANGSQWICEVIDKANLDEANEGSNPEKDDRHKFKGCHKIIESRGLIKSVA
jgi:hypothetical protein